MPDVYPGGADEDVKDQDWLRRADEARWVALTKDERITRRPQEQQTLAAGRLRVFAIGNQHLTGPEMATYFATNIHRIIQRSRKSGPFVDIVYANSVERRWPR